MNGFSELVVPASSLTPGNRVVWFGGTFRVVESIAPMGDGTDHLRVVYSNETTSRYAGKGLVRTLDVCPIDVPVAVLPVADGLCWTDA